MDAELSHCLACALNINAFFWMNIKVHLEFSPELAQINSPA